MAFRATKIGPLLDHDPSFSVTERPANMGRFLEFDPLPLAVAEGLVSWCLTTAAKPGAAQDCSNPEFEEAN